MVDIRLVIAIIKKSGSRYSNECIALYSKQLWARASAKEQRILWT